MRNKASENGLFLIGDVQSLKLKKGQSFEEDFEKDFDSINKGKKKLSSGCQLIFLIVV